MKNSIYTSHIRVPKAYNISELADRFMSLTGLKIPVVRVQDAIALILYHVHHRRQRQRARGKVGRTGMIPFHVEQRRLLIGRNQDKYFDFLVTEGILESNDNPIAGVSSTKYRVLFPRGKYNWIDYTVTDRPSLKRIENLRLTANEQITDLVQKVSSLAQILDLPVVKFDPSYLQRVHQLQEDQLHATTSAVEQFEIREQYRKLAKDMALIEQGDLAFTRDRSGYRLHSRVVRLKKELRPYILINNEPADEVDIKNSQPFFMSVVTAPSFWTPERVSDESLHISDLDHNLRLGLGSESRFFWDVQNVIEGNASLTTSKFRSRNIEVEGREIVVEVEKRWGSILLLAVFLSEHDEPTGLNFVRLARSGTIYDTLTAEYKNRFFDKDGNDLLKDRDTAKLTVLEELYSNPRTARYKGYQPVLEVLFPNFHLFTKLVKERGYKNLALLLQRVEAKLFMEGALENFLETHPNCALLTVHDSVLVPRTFTEGVRAHIETFIENKVGAKPNCSVKASVARPLPVPFVTADGVTPPFL